LTNQHATVKYLGDFWFLAFSFHAKYVVATENRLVFGLHLKYSFAQAFTPQVRRVFSPPQNCGAPQVGMAG
jgi:hypothetical protein